MMNAKDERAEEEVELLLPWFASGALDPDDRRRVETAVARSPRLAASLALIEEDRAAAMALAEDAEIPASMETRFLGQLAAEAGRPKPTPRAPRGLLAATGEWLARLSGAMTPPRLGMAAVAAALIIAIQAGIIVALVGPAERDGPRFEVAAGDKADEDGIAVLVSFAEGAAAADIADFLAGNGGRIADGPLPGGLFKLRFAPAEGRDLDSVMDALKAKPDLFALVLPSQ